MEHEPTNVLTAFEMLLEEVESTFEIRFAGVPKVRQNQTVGDSAIPVEIASATVCSSCNRLGSFAAS